ncbi:MAG: bacteriohemerythrin [Bacteroidales bacterium]|nr:bacteriohemerythrin [Bacteroidales bacterium]
MKKLKWKEEYLVGIDKIDNEHKVFFDLIIEMQKICEQEYDTKRIARYLQELVKYAEFHFYSEENIMIDLEYPEHKEHNKLHQDLLEEIGVKKIELESKSLNKEEFVDFLHHWFIDHTSIEDHKLTEFIQKKTDHTQ